MAHLSSSTPFLALPIAILTVSDTRTADNDESGGLLQARVEAAGHELAGRALCRDDIYRIRAIVSDWIARPDIAVILVTGGTGFSDRDNTPEALQPLFDKTVEGFGELFRHLSLDSVGTSTVQSRALAGLANRTLICAMPGSPRACALAWERIVAPQIDARHKPCNFVGQIRPKAITACAPRNSQARTPQESAPA